MRWSRDGSASITMATSSRARANGSGIVSSARPTSSSNRTAAPAAARWRELPLGCLTMSLCYGPRPAAAHGVGFDRRSQSMPTDQPIDRDQLDIGAHVRRMVDEIERGEDGDGVEAAEKPAAAEPAAQSDQERHGVEHAVRHILIEIGEDP